MNYILRNGYFPFTNEITDIYIKEGIVQNIGEGFEKNNPQAKLIDLEGRILMDGFVDSHMHLDKALIGERIINKSGTLNEAIKIMSKYKSQMTKEDIKERAEKVLEMAFQKGQDLLEPI